MIFSREYSWAVVGYKWILPPNKHQIAARKLK